MNIMLHKTQLFLSENLSLVIQVVAYRVLVLVSVYVCVCVHLCACVGGLHDNIIKENDLGTWN